MGLKLDTSVIRSVERGVEVKPKRKTDRGSNCELNTGDGSCGEMTSSYNPRPKYTDPFSLKKTKT